MSSERGTFFLEIKVTGNCYNIIMSDIGIIITCIDYDGIETVAKDELVDLIIHYGKFTGKSEEDRETLLNRFSRSMLESMVKILVWPNLSKIA